nr:hypothetical protein GCM10020093_061050 [Planobispora longispora]
MKGSGQGLRRLLGRTAPGRRSAGRRDGPDGEPQGGPDGTRPGGRGKRRPGGWRRRIVVALVAFTAFAALPLVFPTGGSIAAAAPCDLSPDLAPEVVGAGVDGLVKPPPPEGAAQAPAVRTNYGTYGMSGLYWHTHELGCDDVAAVLGNAWANTVFSWAKALDRLTITTYQAATTEGPLESIKNVVDDIVQRLSEAMYWPFLRPVVILGAIWLAWYGLIRKRATTTAEGVIWMVLAVTVAVWFFSRPGDLTGLGKVVTDKTGEVVNSAFSGLPGAGGASCLPAKGRPARRRWPAGTATAAPRRWSRTPTRSGPRWSASRG